MIDLAAVRADTPGLRNGINLNAAGAALQPRPIVDAVKAHLDLEMEIGGYAAGEQAEAAAEHFYAATAALLNADPDEIAFTENATRAWTSIFYSIPFGPGDRILTGEAEYASNYISYLQVAARTGARVEAVPSDESGQIDVAALARMIDSHVKLISVTHIPTNSGLVNPAEEIGRIARSAGIPFLLDACQAAGHIPLDVEALGCDALSATGRKFLRGPRGTGLLYVRKAFAERLEPHVLDLHSADWTQPGDYRVIDGARRFETWECFVAGKLGLGMAIDYANRIGLPAIEARITALADRFRAALAAIPGVTVTDIGRRKCGIVSFTLAGMDAETAKQNLAARGVSVTASPAKYTLLDMRARGLGEGVVRSSVHYYNSEAEIDQAAEHVAAILR